MSAPKPSLRAACDNCYQAKVKCIPTPSGCQRCISLFSRCFHSPPGRPGRVPTVRSAPFNPESSNIPIPIQGEQKHEPGDLHLSLKGLTGDGVLSETATLDTPLNPWVPMDSPSINETLYGEAVLSFPEFAIEPPILTPTDGQWNDFGDDKKSCACFVSILQALEKAQRTDLQSFGLDVALRHNKDALLGVCNSIKCSIPHDSTTRLLILILLRKSLKLYQILFHLRLSAKGCQCKGNESRISPIFSTCCQSGFIEYITSTEWSTRLFQRTGSSTRREARDCTAGYSTYIGLVPFRRGG